MRIINSLITICFFTLQISAQDIHFKCGVTSSVDVERLTANLEAAQTLEARSGVQYLPVTMTLIANDDGSGLITENAALDGFCRLNQNFEDLGIQFYLRNGFRYVYDSNFYPINGQGNQNPSSLKIPNTINIFVSEIFTEGSVGCSGVLGFYSPPNDYIAIEKCILNGESFALSHEMGHFFSLNHTFLGWENEEYNANEPTPQFINGIRVEYADGSNCSIAADRICDTPPDYNFGFGASGCNYTGNAVDPAGNAVEPDETNFMGYFFNCSEYNFSPIQQDVIHADIASRFFVNDSPNTAAINDEATLSYPINGETTPNNNVTLSWSTVTGATDYLVEINRFANFSPSFAVESAVVSTNSFTATDLLPNANYYWRVRPFNETHTCTDYTSAFFKTGELVDVVEIEGIESLRLYPNPSSDAAHVLLEINTKTTFDAQVQLYDTQGKMIRQFTHQFNAGANSAKINTENLSQGTYILAVHSDNGVAYQRLLITN